MHAETEAEIRTMADAASNLLSMLEELSPAGKRAFTIASLNSGIGRQGLKRELNQLVSMLCKALGDT